MVPVIASNGASFNGAFRYYCHDKQGQTTERVEWTQTVNMLTDCVAKAWNVMAYTAKNQDRLKEASGQKATGRKLNKPVFAFSLSWAPEQRPDRPTMLEAAKRSLEALGLSEHQAIIVAHNDRPHRHVHVVANTVHPLTGLVAQLKHTKRKLSEFALQYEREDGKIYCSRREDYYERRQRGEKTLYSDPDIAEAWRTTTTGDDFKAALEARGFVLAQGRKRLVVVDPHGKVHNPTRLLKDVRAADFNRRLEGVDLSQLPDADDAGTTVKRKAAPENKPEAPQDQPDARKADPQPEAQPDDETQDRTPLKDPEPEAAPTDHREPDTAPSGQREQSAFEELAAEQTAELRERQQEELRRTRDQVGRRFVAARKRLLAYHDLPARKAALLRLREKIETAPWWKRLIGVTRRDRRRMGEELRSYRESLTLYRESLAHVRSRAHDSLNELAQRQAEDRTRLEANIERLRERNSLFRGTDEREKGRAAGSLRDRDPRDSVARAVGKISSPPDAGGLRFVSFDVMNDITDTSRANGARSTEKKEDAALVPPGEAEFERFVDMMSRDLRRAQTQEVTSTVKVHFHPDNPDAGGIDHDQKGNDLLTDLSKKHTHEQIVFRTCVGKLRSLYSKERQQQTAPDRKSPQIAAEKPSGFERSL